MRQVRTRRKRLAFRILVVTAALSWVAADLAAQQRATSSRSSSGSSSSASSGGGSSSSSRSSASARSSSSSGSRSGVRSSGSSRGSASTRNQARPRSGARGGSGAARTRPQRQGSGGSRTTHHGGHGYHGYGYYGYSPYYWHPWGYWGWGYGYSHYGYGPAVVYSTRRGYRMGALDLKVRPKNTEVYVDGQYVGLAKQYDGFPGHLWLESGVHEITFYRDGLQNETRRVRILTDLILDLEVSMSPGEAIQPVLGLPPPAPDEDEMTESASPRPATDPGRLHLAIHPGTARVFLDGRLLGTGEEVSSLHAGLVLAAGSHTLEIVRDGFRKVQRQVQVEAGGEVEVNVALQPLGYGTR